MIEYLEKTKGKGRIRMTLGEKIRDLRNKRGMKQEDLAKRVKVAGRLISLYENDKTIPSTDVVRRIAEVFGVTTDYLIYKDDRNGGIIKDRELFNEISIIDKMSEEEKEFIKRLLRALIVDNRLKDVVCLKSE